MKTQSDWRTTTRTWPGSVSKIDWPGKAASITLILCSRLHFSITLPPLHQKEAFLTPPHHMIHYPACPHEQSFNMSPHSWSIGAGQLYVSGDKLESSGKRGLTWLIASIWWAVGMSQGHFLKLMITCPSQPWAGCLVLYRKPSWESHREQARKPFSSWSLPQFPPPSSCLDTLKDVLELASQINPLSSQAALGQYFIPATEKQRWALFY